MTYKGMLLSALLVPVIVNAEIKDIDLRITNLTNVQLKKMNELSMLSKQIAEKQAVIDAWDDQLRSLIDHSTKRWAELEAPLNVFADELEKHFYENREMAALYPEGFSVTENYEFDFLKAYLIRRYLARLEVAELILHYEQCFRELIAQ